MDTGSGKGMTPGTDTRLMSILAVLLLLAGSLEGFLLHEVLSRPHIHAPRSADRPRNVVLIGWDGADRAVVTQLLARHELPNLERLVAMGGLAETEVTSGQTQTKPGWAEILTGCNASFLNIHDNRYYEPIPAGMTLFERLKASSETQIATILISGRTNDLGGRGPHTICMNCVLRDPKTQDPTTWWDRSAGDLAMATSDGKPQDWDFRRGEPFFNALTALDLHEEGVGPADKVGERALLALDNYHGQPFFAFFHFEEPDEQGHRHGRNSKEYEEAIMSVDLWLGRILERLVSLRIQDKTPVIVTSEHGFDADGLKHEKAPHTFVASSHGQPANGDRKDIAPTVLSDYGLVMESPLGRSLIALPAGARN